MALKGKEWFYKQCLKEVKQFSPLAHLCWDILEKGIGQRDSTRGHVTQAIGATQRFLDAFPGHRRTIGSADPTRPFDIIAQNRIRSDWVAWLRRKRGQYGREAFRYNITTLRGYLTRLLGGRCRGGGGGDDEFKRVLRLMASFIGRP